MDYFVKHLKECTRCVKSRFPVSSIGYLPERNFCAYALSQAGKSEILPAGIPLKGQDIYEHAGRRRRLFQLEDSVTPAGGFGRRDRLLVVVSQAADVIHVHSHSSRRRQKRLRALLASEIGFQSS